MGSRQTNKELETENERLIAREKEAYVGGWLDVYAGAMLDYTDCGEVDMEELALYHRSEAEEEYADWLEYEDAKELDNL
ncbi:MAG: hypothetical protein LUE27_06840 [Clostridia bacterium]|nr:hypothetical protein [Clostridia bacterium]